MTASAAKKARSARARSQSASGGEGSGGGREEEEAAGVCDALLIGALPHDWLFPFLRAVIHHGGAGNLTFAACGLLYLSLSPPLSSMLSVCMSVGLCVANLLIMFLVAVLSSSVSFVFS
jgi:hypothetical protein